MASELTNVRRRANQLVRDYQVEFGGRSRITRDRAALERIAGEAAVLDARLADETLGPRSELEALRRTVAWNREKYEAELAALEETSRLGADYGQFARSATHANALLACYERRFARRHRVCADPVFLDDLLQCLVRLEEPMRALASKPRDGSPHGYAPFLRDVETLGRAIAFLKTEASAIAEAQTSGTFLERHVVLAGLHNALRSGVKKQFSGRPRAAVRPGMVERQLRAFDRTLKMMVALKEEGFSNLVLEQNIAIVTSDVRTMGQEHAAVAKARAEIWPVVLVGALQDSVRTHTRSFEQTFVGRTALHVNMDRLDWLCDELHEVLRQLDEVRPGLRDSNHEECVDSALVLLVRMERAHAHVVAARRTSVE